MTLYESERKELPRHYVARRFLNAALVLAVLILARQANLWLGWLVTKAELSAPAMASVPATAINMLFLGFSSGRNAVERLQSSLPYQQKKTAATAYFDLLHPAAFVVSSHAPATFIGLGRLTVAVAPGLSHITIGQPGMVIMVSSAGRQVAWMESAPLAFFIKAVSLALDPAAAGLKSPSRPISYVLDPPSRPGLLRIPHLIYFLLPLLLIPLLAMIYGQALLTAFLYYPGLFLLFDFREVFIATPFSWLFGLLRVEPSNALSGWLAALLLVLFLLPVFWGIWAWKKNAAEFTGRWLVVIFVLLPLTFRF